MCLLRITLPILCPNMIYVDALDFSERHSEEVISFFWRLVRFCDAVGDNPIHLQVWALKRYRYLCVTFSDLELFDCRLNIFKLIFKVLLRPHAADRSCQNVIIILICKTSCGQILVPHGIELFNALGYRSILNIKPHLLLTNLNLHLEFN